MKALMKRGQAASIAILATALGTAPAWSQDAPAEVADGWVHPLEATTPYEPIVSQAHGIFVEAGFDEPIIQAPGEETLFDESILRVQAENYAVEEPIMSQQPPPFSFPAGSGGSMAGGNDANAFAGHAPVQDVLTNLLSGNFKETKYKWYGFVRLDGIYDFEPIGSTDSFVTSAIPIPQGDGRNAVLTPRYTRIGWDTTTPAPVCDWTIKTRIEVDFFNGNTSGAFGSFPLRLRFAWIDIGPFLIGQAASLFMDYDAYPNVLDYQGPAGMILMRQPLLAVRVPITDGTKFTIGMEQPYSDIQWFDGANWIVNPGRGVITTPGVAKNIQEMPDFTANLRTMGDHGHLQVAGILRRLTYQSPAGLDDSEAGYGINLTGTFHPWAFVNGTAKDDENASPMEKSRFLAQYAAGRGINRYLNDVNGLGLDATFDPVNGFDALFGDGWFVAYEQWWTDNVISNFTYGHNHTSLSSALPANTYKSATYVTANLIWLPFERFGLGVEGLYGERENRDGQTGEAARIQFGVQYKF
jgi:hypothetical protein